MKLTIEDYEAIHAYCENWRHDEEWTDLNVALDQGDTVYSAYLLCSAGVFDETVEIEAKCIAAASEYSKLSHKEKMAHLDSTFGECFISSCEDCNHVSFLDCGNENLYPEVKETCWNCGSSHIEAYYWNDKKTG